MSLISGSSSSSSSSNSSVTSMELSMAAIRAAAVASFAACSRTSRAAAAVCAAASALAVVAASALASTPSALLASSAVVSGAAEVSRRGGLLFGGGARPSTLNSPTKVSGTVGTGIGCTTSQTLAEGTEAAASLEGTVGAALPPASARAMYGFGGPLGGSIPGLNALLIIWAASALTAGAVAAASFKGAGAAAAPPLSARVIYGLGGPPGWSIAGLNAMFIWAVSALTFWLLPGGIAPDVLACADFGNPHTHVPNVAAVMSSLYLSQAHAAHPASLLDSAMFKDATW